MKITIEPTGEFQRVNGEPARIWKGVDEHGVPVPAHIRMVSPQTHDADVNDRYHRELIALGRSERDGIAIDVRMVL
jgi:hypothetical protein